MTIDYSDDTCKHCANRGQQWCVGCAPVLMTDGTHKRSRFCYGTTTITATTRVDYPPTEEIKED